MSRALLLIFFLASWGVPQTVYADNMASCLFSHHSNSSAMVIYKYKFHSGPEDSIQGSGFIISADGHLITSNHVLGSQLDRADIVSESVEVHLDSAGSPPIRATIVTRDPETDLALIKLEASATPYVPVVVGDSAKLSVGDPLYGLGFPQSDLAIIPQGQILSRNALVGDTLKPWWQTSLALNPGVSGGPIFGNLDTVVGVATAFRSSTQLISFVIPIQYASHLLSAGGASVELAGPCAELPSCRDPSHGQEGWAIQVPVGAWSPWRGGGYNRNANCNDYLTQLRVQFPNSTFTKVKDDEHSRESGFRHFDYQYYCEFLRQEQPIYREARGVECLSGLK